MTRTERVFQILDLLKEQQLTIKQIMIKLNIDDSTIYRDISLLLNLEKIKPSEDEGFYKVY